MKADIPNIVQAIAANSSPIRPASQASHTRSASSSSTSRASYVRLYKHGPIISGKVRQDYCCICRVGEQMKNLLKRFVLPVLLTVTLLGVGCATSSPIQKHVGSESSFNNPTELISHDYPDEDIYQVYHRASTGFVSIQSIRQSAEQRASNFAAQQGKDFVVLGEQISEPPYILGNFPRIEIVFALIDKVTTPTTETRSDKYGDLERLKKLLDDGAITQDEYDTEKAKILSN